MRSLFNFKVKTSHISSVVYEEDSFGEDYIGETAWDEHCDAGKNSEPAKHLYKFSKYKFNWKILRRVQNKENS